MSFLVDANSNECKLALANTKLHDNKLERRFLINCVGAVEIEMNKSVIKYGFSGG